MVPLQGIIGSSWGEEGKGIYGIAVSNKLDANNYGGYFVTDGGIGTAVFGEARSSGNSKNYGGYFMTRGILGIGCYGLALGENGRGIMGKNQNGYYGYLGTKNFRCRVLWTGTNSWGWHQGGKCHGLSNHDY